MADIKARHHHCRTLLNTHRQTTRVRLYYYPEHRLARRIALD